jgi:hypothetical protein
MFLCSNERRFSVPAHFLKRRAQRLSTLTEGHRGTRREAVLTAASTAPSLMKPGGSCRRLGRIEGNAVRQHSMQDHSQLPGERNFCLLKPRAPDKLRRPALQGPAF